MIGTLLAIVVYFRHEVLRLGRAWGHSVLHKQHNDDSRLAWLILAATLPAGIAGALGNAFIEQHLRSTAVIATTTIVFGLALLWADKSGSRRLEEQAMTLRAALLIGVAQALALIPGTSRSGITMTAALLLGFTREAAARFSFLLSIPLIAAAGSLKTLELAASGDEHAWGLISIGALVSFVSAYVCIAAFLRFLERIGFTPFVIYRLVLGAVLIIMLWW